MKGMSSLKLENNTNDLFVDEIISDEKDIRDYREIGDVDELIFPDEEEYYVSER